MARSMPWRCDIGQNHNHNTAHPAGRPVPSRENPWNATIEERGIVVVKTENGPSNGLGSDFPSLGLGILSLLDCIILSTGKSALFG